ncbi:MAG TPA: hypothetical protein VEA77_07870, partial [Hyphomicrobium sp.]|nr:hypothetical protein [Hyphomicrobium sp.]
GSPGDPRVIDSILFKYVRYLRGSYRSLGDPVLVYLAAARLESQVRIYHGATSSFQYTKLLALMAEMLVEEGRDEGRLSLALEHIEAAIETLNRVPVMSEEVLGTYVSCYLYRSVIQKALGNYDVSISGLVSSRRTLVSKMEMSNIDLIMLERQEVIMLQDMRLYRRLAENAASYAVLRPMEYYGTVKRIFEFCVTSGKLEDADKMLPEFKRAFDVISNRLPPISKIAFYRDIGLFLMCCGKTKSAESILRPALQRARSLNLHGQQRQITGIIGGGPSTSVSLPTFRVR